MRAVRHTCLVDGQHNPLLSSTHLPPRPRPLNALTPPSLLDPCRILSIQPFLNATKISLQLHCNVTATPWCQPGAIGKRQAPLVRHAAAVHAVSGAR